uniref:BHLH domain-containing protein n=1 Tax=Glossina austeni TaxID=7395 RepID=A0A1A9V3G8_GLOAU
MIETKNSSSSSSSSTTHLPIGSMCQNMTDQPLISLTNEQTPTALIPTSTTIVADGADNNYNLITDTDKPIILELGICSASTTQLSVPYSNGYPIETLNSYESTRNETAFTGLCGSISSFPPVPSSSTSPQSSATPPPVISANSNLINNTNSLIVPVESNVPLSPALYSWPSSNRTQVISSQIEVKLKLRKEMVPLPTYISYASTHEHFISKEINPSRTERALQSEKEYKKTACDRERTRMRDMNRAYDLLRSKLPISKPNGKKFSKIETLRISIGYIKDLLKQLQENPEDYNISPSKSNRIVKFVDYKSALNSRKRSQSLQYEQKSIYNDESSGKDIDEANISWNDSYLLNGTDKWE